MADERFLLDTSALLTLIENGDGAARVEGLLRDGKVLLPWLVLLEVYYLSYQEEGEIKADQRLAMLKQLDLEIMMEAGEEVLLTAGRLRATHPISLADSIIAAFAVQHKAILIHNDPAYQVLAAEVSLECLNGA
jgi:predicted nucleic acid-binding protein